MFLIPTIMIFGLVSSPETITKKFQVPIPEKLDYSPNYNLRPSDQMLFFSSENTFQFTKYRYGMLPSFSKEERIIYTAPVQKHSDPNPNAPIKKDIIQNTDFRNAIRTQRGLLPVDYFIVQSQQGIPYLIFMRDNKRPFGIGCIWDAWKKDIMDDLTYGFSVITVPVTGLFADFGITQFPLVISEYNQKKWIKKDTHLSAITAMLEPINEKLFNGYEISERILECRDNDRGLIEPSGDLLVKDEKSEIKFKKQRYYHKDKEGDDKIKWGERLVEMK